MNNSTDMNNPAPLAILKKRVAQNYADFESEILCLSDEEEIYEMAHRIAAVQDAYEQLTGDSDCLDDGEAAHLLKFQNPLEMVADFLQERQANCPDEIDEALMELFNAENLEENYLTVGFAEELAKKYGAGVSAKSALLKETIEAGKRYVRLLKLSGNADSDAANVSGDITVPFKPYEFDEDGFFIYEDDGEGCF